MSGGTIKRKIKFVAIIGVGTNLVHLKNMGGKSGLNGNIILDNYYKGNYNAYVYQTGEMLLLNTRERQILDKAIIASYDKERKQARKKYEKLMEEMLPRYYDWKDALDDVLSTLEIDNAEYIIPSIEDVWRLTDKIRGNNIKN